MFRQELVDRRGSGGMGVVESALTWGCSAFSERVWRMLERVEYRRAETAQEKEAIFRLRYDAYMREGAIEPNAARRFCDPFDEVANVWIIGMFIDGELASSIRLHVADAEDAPLPAQTVFPDILGPRLRRREVIVDPTRFVTRLDFSRRYHEMPYLTVRPGWMAGEFFGADHILATIRVEHQGYYRRVFGHELWCGARDYPTLNKPIACMGLDYFARRDRVERRYPFYRSSPAERQRLFGRSSNPGAAKSGAVSWFGPSQASEAGSRLRQAG
jgi:hypothetical protein